MDIQKRSRQQATATSHPEDRGQADYKKENEEGVLDEDDEVISLFWDDLK